MVLRGHAAWVLLGIPMLALGCASGGSSAEKAAESAVESVPAEGAPAEQSAPAKVSDAEIAAIVVVANTVDAETGDLAVAQASNPAVKDFGQTMARDHRAVNEQASALVAKLGVTPQESEVSRKLRADGTAFQQELKAKSGAEFDRAYVAHEVAYHQAVLDAVDKLLIPNATNAELKQTLIGVRPAFEGHLRMARELEASLK